MHFSSIVCCNCTRPSSRVVGTVYDPCRHWTVVLQPNTCTYSILCHSIAQDIVNLLLREWQIHAFSRVQPEKHSLYAECGVCWCFRQSFNAIKLNYIKLSFSFGCRLMRFCRCLSHTHTITSGAGGAARTQIVCNCSLHVCNTVKTLSIPIVVCVCVCASVSLRMAELPSACPPLPSYPRPIENLYDKVKI